VRAVLVEEFGRRPRVVELDRPTVTPDGVVVRVEATGLCRSDWHGWQGHDRDIVLPHVPGHELAGVVVEAGSQVVDFAVGDRVTVPFVCGCGRCSQCRSGNSQTCLSQQQPGFTFWGSFAEYVALPWADGNLIRLPDQLGWSAAASLGCRFATAYRAVRQVAGVAAGERVAVFGCGGVGMSAVMIAAAAGAEVIAVDVDPAALAQAAAHGAHHIVRGGGDVAASLRALNQEGVDVAVDAIGSASVVQSALASLRPRGRLVQVGLLPATISIDAGALIGRELQWLGSHGMSGTSYPGLLADIADGVLDPAALIAREITLDEVPDSLVALGTLGAGVTIIRPGQ
jgi:alcohol dehydrogenase